MVVKLLLVNYVKQNTQRLKNKMANETTTQQIKLIKRLNSVETTSDAEKYNK